MGLLDMNFEDPRTMGLLSAAAHMLQASGPSRTPVGFGHAVSQGLLGGMQGMQQAQQMQAEKQLREMQMKRFGLGMEKDQMEIEEARRKAKAEQGVMDAAQASIMSPQYQSLLGGGGPTVANAAKIDGLSPSFDTNGFIDRVMAVDPLKGLALRQSLAKESQFNKIDPKDYTTESIARFSQTHNFADLVPRVKLEQVDMGGKIGFRNPYETTITGTLGKTMTPGEQASNSLGWANNSLSRQRFAFDQTQANAPQFNNELGGFVGRPSANAPQGSFTPLVGANARAPKMTEDQAKATGWLVQAENAFKNMQAVGLDKNGGITSAAKPGFNDALAAIPSFGLGEAIGNSFRSADRQKFIQSSSSLSEALLRAATGAGVNKDEAAQKVRELTPVFGEDESVTKQKMASIPLYIESLKVRSGPGAKLAEGVMKSSVPLPNGWTVTER